MPCAALCLRAPASRTMVGYAQAGSNARSATERASRQSVARTLGLGASAGRRLTTHSAGHWHRARAQIRTTGCVPAGKCARTLFRPAQIRIAARTSASSAIRSDRTLHSACAAARARRVWTATAKRRDRSSANAVHHIMTVTSLAVASAARTTASLRMTFTVSAGPRALRRRSAQTGHAHDMNSPMKRRR